MKLKMRYAFWGLAIATSMLSCKNNEEKEDAVNSVSKNGSVETVVSVEHAEDADILVTKHKIWVKQNLTKEIIQRDTIPALGDTLQTITDDSGNSVQKQTKKDYEFYITVQ